MLEHFKRRWIRERGRLIKLQAIAADRSGIFAGVTKSMRILLQTVLLAVGAMLAINDEVSAGVIVAASMLMSRALAPVEATIGGWRQCLAAHGAFVRLNRLLASAPAAAAPDAAADAARRAAARGRGGVAARLQRADLAQRQLRAGARRGAGRGRQQRLGQVDAGSGRDRRLAAATRARSGSMAPRSRATAGTSSGPISAICPRRSSCSRARWPRTSPGSASSMP